ncbi:MAG: hypothetical protein ACRDDZ_05960 [Marinifilaceae bacterium]
MSQQAIKSRMYKLHDKFNVRNTPELIAVTTKLGVCL